MQHSRLRARWRKHTSVTLFAAAAIAMAAGGLAHPAVSHAEKVWDVGKFDNCVKAAEKRFGSGQTDTQTYTDEVRFCCETSGGEWSQTQGCTAPPATFQTQPQTPGSVVAPRPGKAALP